MKNRAKCKLCQSIIQSFHTYDYVSCKCGEISIDGGDEVLRVYAKNWENFLRIDDEGNEIVVKVEEENTNVKPLYIEEKPTRQYLLKMLEDMENQINTLPPEAMNISVNHHDFSALLTLLNLIFKSENQEIAN